MEYQAPGICPVCGHALHVTRLSCDQCGTELEGKFSFPRMAQLSSEHQQFVQIFLQAEGKLNRVQEILGISYPTARARLLEVVRAMGYEVSARQESEMAERVDKRKAILEEIAAGRLSVDEALGKLKTLK